MHAKSDTGCDSLQYSFGSTGFHAWHMPWNRRCSALTSTVPTMPILAQHFSHKPVLGCPGSLFYNKGKYQGLAAAAATWHFIYQM